MGFNSAFKGLTNIYIYLYLTELAPPVRANYSVFAKAQTRRKTLMKIFIGKRNVCQFYKKWPCTLWIEGTGPFGKLCTGAQKSCLPRW